MYRGSPCRSYVKLMVTNEANKQNVINYEVPGAETKAMPKCQKSKQILQIFYSCQYSRMRQEDLTTLSQMKKEEKDREKEHYSWEVHFNIRLSFKNIQQNWKIYHYKNWEQKEEWKDKKCLSTCMEWQLLSDNTMFIRKSRCRHHSDVAIMLLEVPASSCIPHWK